MSVAVVPTVEVFFDLSAAGVDDFLTLDDPVKGQLDDALYPLAGPIATDVTDTCYRVDIRRGRNRETDEIDTGTCTVGLRNYDARWLPIGLNDTRLYDESGEVLTDGSGNPLFTDAGVYLDQVEIGKRVRITTADAIVFDGYIDDYRYSYSPDGRVDAEFTAIDNLGRLARQEFDEWTTTGSQTAGPRITASLNRSEVNFPYARDIGAGVSTLQSDTVSWGSNVLNYLQLVARSDAGRLFVSRDGALTFRDRHDLVNATVLATFADDGTGIPFVGIEPATTAEVLYNRVGVDREGGTLQTSNRTASQDKYGIRTLSLPGLLLSTDEQCADMADYLSGIYSEPQNRIAAITVALDGVSVLQRALVTQLDMADAVTVTWTPEGSTSDPVVQTSAVEGISHSTSVDGLYLVTLSLSPIAQTEAFILDDAVLGLLDSGVLAF